MFIARVGCVFLTPMPGGGVFFAPSPGGSVFLTPSLQGSGALLAPCQVMVVGRNTPQPGAKKTTPGNDGVKNTPPQVAAHGHPSTAQGIAICQQSCSSHLNTL